jgi:hypothetical protein
LLLEFVMARRKGVKTVSDRPEGSKAVAATASTTVETPTTALPSAPTGSAAALVPGTEMGEPTRRQQTPKGHPEDLTDQSNENEDEDEDGETTEQARALRRLDVF